MSNILKIIGIIVLAFIAFIAWRYISNNAGTTGWQGVLGAWQRRVTISDDELWANPSPYRGSVLFDSMRSRATETDPEYEYIYIDAATSNGSAVDLSGWSVESLVSRTRVYFPPAVLLLKMAAQNVTSPVYLAPGEYAILHTGRSPVGSSFHTNRCIGYLEQFNDFTPHLPYSCPHPSEILPATVENIRAYGSECVDFFASTAQQCTTYVTAMPAELLPVCRELVAHKLNYNTCLSDVYSGEGYDVFNNGGWYLYLNNTAELWNNEYEILRLLDAQGRTVAVLRY